jgi:hypothetical protein
MHSGSGWSRLLYRIRTGVQWCDLPERYGPWKTVHERHRRWSADGTWELLLQRVQAEADAAGDIDWDVSVDSTSVRAHHHAAGARQAPPPVVKGGSAGTVRAARIRAEVVGGPSEGAKAHPGHVAIDALQVGVVDGHLAAQLPDQRVLCGAGRRG